MTNVLEFFLDLVFPRLCVQCKKTLTKEERGVCAPCFEHITPHRTLFCGECRARLPMNKKTCHKDFPYRLGPVANYHENEPLKNLIQSLKFNYNKDAVSPLCSLLIAYTKELSIPFHNYVVVPMPLSRERRRERGFNQVEEVALPFATHFNLPYRTDLMTRIKNTPPQSSLKGTRERKENIAACFAVHAPSVLGKNIILLDDVTTSGATLLEAARTLKAAGAKDIVALTLAHV